MKTYEEMANNALARGKAIRKQTKRKKILITAVSLMLLVAIGIGMLGDRENNLIAKPQYPQMARNPDYDDNSADIEAQKEAYLAWSTSQSQQYNQPEGYADSLTEFFADSMTEFLQGEGNPTYSPLNAYMAMAMLAETTDGNSRQQILDLFGVDTIEQLRQQASYVWNAHYSDDGQTTLLLANSLWLDNAYGFKKPTAQLLANYYFASSYSGDLGTKKMDQLLQNWLDENTGGLLKDQTENVKLNPQTVFSLVSTVYFSADWWTTRFYAGNTKESLFHAPNDDLLTFFMNQTFIKHTYYWADNFGAVSIGLSGENKMWLILPEEGYTTADVLSSNDYLEMTLNPEKWENQKIFYKIHLSLPKFDVTSQQDLIAGMKNLGVTDVFDSEISDFAPMTDTQGVYVSGINHAVRVAIDEKGCTAGAFTVIMQAGITKPLEEDEMDFVLDRPFLFVVSSRDNLPLFAGIINEP